MQRRVAVDSYQLASLRFATVRAFPRYSTSCREPRMKRFIFAVLLSSLSAIVLAQNTEVAPNENLIVEGVPKIPASLAETVERYTNFRGASLDSWDPVKREMLISTRFADTAQIHLVKMPGGARTQLTFYPDSVSGAQYSPASGNSFVFSKDIGGNEFFQVYRFDNESGDVTLLTDGKSRNVGGSMVV